MNKMISVASGFQYSVNIGYDINSVDKLKNFIPTRSSLELLESILLSTNDESTERSRVLIGAYGKGKSHIVLTILSLLMRKELSCFEKLLPKLQENTKLYQLVLNYYDSGKKILPVVISGSNTSLSQAFLISLQRTLAENDLLDIMPETNYQAAVDVINRWQSEFPETFIKFEESIEGSVTDFIDALMDYDINAYEKFEQIYPTLTSGSVFNPFLGFDVIDLYVGVIKELKKKGYSGIYVIYDEFSKYLEANITEASVSDTKMLQDFAEKCNRSAADQMHIMLISHKEIANYIDKLPKQKVDGWRGVSERFLHVHMNNNFSQTYEIISSVIQKDASKWKKFCKENKKSFEAQMVYYKDHSIFSDSDCDPETVIYSCYPLQPVSTFILPRLSERIAQNERTLFTFLSATGANTLSDYLDDVDESAFSLLTPDEIYDYFEPLFKKEVYSGTIHDNYILTSRIIDKLPANTLEVKIVKTISLIYVLEQFEKLQPTQNELVGIFSVDYSVEEIETAIKNLIEKEYVVYLRRSNNFLRLKQTSGVDIRQKINDTASTFRDRIQLKDILNQVNFDNYMYPSRYNDEKEITRYFAFVFISSSEIDADTDWNIKSENISADGIIYAIIPDNNEDIARLKRDIKSSSKDSSRYIFVLPQRYVDIENIAREFYAVGYLREQVTEDRVLFDEYEVIYDDLREYIQNYIFAYTRPENNTSTYYYMGSKKRVYRKSDLSELMSSICDSIFSETPIIINESINKNELTSTANNSRSRIIAGLLRNELEYNLGLTGTGQEVSIMRSTLINTGVLINDSNVTSICLSPADEKMNNMLNVIVDFIKQGKDKAGVSFDILFNRLMAADYKIGLKRGLVLIYLSAVLHEFKKEIIISDKFGQIQLTADSLLLIEAHPQNYTLSNIGWDPVKEQFVDNLSDIFSKYVVDGERNSNSYDYVVSAMRRWFMSLPKYVKEMRVTPDGSKIDKRYAGFLKLLKSNIGSYQFLFEKLPDIYGYEGSFTSGLSENIQATKDFFDKAIERLEDALIILTKEVFSDNRSNKANKRMSLTSVIRDWCESLDDHVFEQLFVDGTDKQLGLLKTITNDERTFIERLAKATTELRIEDWEDSTLAKFDDGIRTCKQTAESFHADIKTSLNQSTEAYQLTFVEDNGQSTTKRFEKVETSKKGSLLHNVLTADLESMGQAISVQEKRQILMDILKEMC